MNHHQAAQDVRTLFDWRRPVSAADDAARSATSGPVGNGDLELALQLLACNSRDRALFAQGRSAPSAA